MWWGDIIPDHDNMNWGFGKIAKDVIDWLSSWF